MEDLSQKLTQLLARPDAAEKLSEAAQALLGGNTQTPVGSNGGAEDLFGDVDVGALVSAMSALRAGGPDTRAALLLALRPHLSHERQGRVDTAVKLLKLTQLLPLLKEGGLLNL